jgi:S1-C subfamily serine protease
MAKEFLSQKGVSYREVDVSRDQAAAQEMMRRSGQSGVPVITFDNETVIGFDRPRLEQLAAAATAGATSKGGKPSLGLSVADASKIALQHGQLPVFGAYVGKVRAGGPGHRAGIAVGDIITQIGIRPIHSAADVETALNAIPAGSRVPIVFQRSNQTLSAEAQV